MRRRFAVVSIIVVSLAILVVALPTPCRHPFVLLSLWRERVPPQVRIPVMGVRSRELLDTWHAARTEGRMHEG